MEKFNAIMKAINDCGLAAKIRWDEETGVTRISIFDSLENIRTDPDYTMLNEFLDSEKMIETTYNPQFNFDGFYIIMDW